MYMYYKQWRDQDLTLGGGRGLCQRGWMKKNIKSVKG